MGYIYKIYNDINDKIYVGKTCSTIAERWSKHLYAYTRYDWHLYRAMRKYGVENFHIEAIEECTNENLDEKEKYWIKYYNSFEKGYNMTIGGDGRKQLDREVIVALWNKGKSVRDIAESLDCWYSSVVSVLKESELYDKEEVARRKMFNMAAKQSKNRIIKYSETGKILKIYDSAHEASYDTGIPSDGIRSALNCGGSRGGFFWGREGEKLPNFHPIKKCQHRKIGQYDLQDNLITIHSSAADAARSLGKGENGASFIRKVCTGEGKTAYNFKWRFIEE